MKTMEKCVRRPSPGRRRFVSMLAGSAVCGLTLIAWRVPRKPEALDLREADFYKRHDLAG